jgi:predicted Zn-ribbon and HTH transcriptional regulator
MSFDLDLKMFFVCNYCKERFEVYKEDIGTGTHCPKCKSRDIEFSQNKIEKIGSKK